MIGFRMYFVEFVGFVEGVKEGVSFIFSDLVVGSVIYLGEG